MRLSLSLALGLLMMSLSSGACSAEPSKPGPLPTPVMASDPAAAVLKPAAPQPRKRYLSSRRGLVIHRISSAARKMQGVPYVFGGTSPYGFDCSGFTSWTFARAGIRLRRMADEQYYQGKPVKVAEPGDLVFFETYCAGPSHVGIYLGGGNFIHASSSRGVTISGLSESYWRARYIGARRFF